MNQPWTWRVLSDEQISQIREAALTHIERHGFVVQHQALLARSRERGARVEDTQGRIRMSRSLVAELMAQVPRQYTIGNVLGESWVVGGAEQYGTAIVTDPWIIDYATGEPRHPCLEDLRRNTIVAEQLEPVVSISRMDYPVTDVSGPESSLRALEMHLLHHTSEQLVDGYQSRVPGDVQEGLRRHFAGLCAKVN